MTTSGCVGNGSEIRQQRRLKALTVEALATASGLDKRTIRRAENGESVALETLKAIAAVLGCEPAAIMASAEQDVGRPEPFPRRSDPEHGLQAEEKAISETVVLIPAAGPVPDGLFTHVTVPCLSLLPVCGKPIISWQLGWLRKQGFKRFVVAVAKDTEREQLKRFLTAAFPNLEVEIIVDLERGGVGRTVKLLLETALAGSKVPSHALVNLGDTIAEFSTYHECGQAKGAVDWTRNWVLYDLTPDSKRWSVYRTDESTGCTVFEEKKDFEFEKYGVEATFKALVGVYYFTDASAALTIAKAVDREVDRPMEMSDILNRLEGVMLLYQASFWADSGHADRLMVASAALLGKHGLNERDFNRVNVDAGRGTLEKTLSSRALPTEREKFIHEIEYFMRLPKPLRIHFPRVVEAEPDWDAPRLVMEYYPYTSLSDLWVYGSLEPDVWSRIFDHIREIMSEFAAIKRPANKDDLERMYSGKTLDRVNRLQAGLATRTDGDPYAAVLRGLLKGQNYYTHAGHRVRNLAEPLPEHALSLLRECRTFTVIHGDLGFPNVLIQLPSGICKLVDPRGSFGTTNGIYGDSCYDLAKINHSLEGYDFIVNDLFDVTIEGNALELSVYYPEGYQRVRDRFSKIFLPEPDGPHGRRRVGLITGLLFASMMPLHPEPRRQLAMYLTADRLLANLYPRPEGRPRADET